MFRSFRDVLKTGFLPAMMILITGCMQPGEKLAIHDPWVREAPPNAPVLAAYMVIENTSDKTIIINSISSPEFVKTEIHMSGEKDGMAVMEQQDQLVIEPHQKVTLKPGGLHLMLINPKNPLKAGDNVNLQLSFADDSNLSVSAKVVKKTGVDHAAHDHDDKHSQHTQ